jgi:hypothetical protein
MDRFLSFTSEPIDMKAINKCNFWTGPPNNTRKGALHGSFCYRGKLIKAHRFSYETFVGSIPEGLLVLHKCPEDSDGRCVNPLHLSPGTAKENTRDSMEKGVIQSTRVKGEKNGKSILTEEKVRSIRLEYESGLYTMDDLAKKYEIYNSSICRIIHRKAWKHVK